MGALAQLVSLNLYNNQISDGGLTALADACATGAWRSSRSWFFIAHSLQWMPQLP